MAKRGKTHKTYQEKCEHILMVMNFDARRREAVGYTGARQYTLAEVAKLAGYARSTKFLNHLYSMVDGGSLKMLTVNREVNGRGITDINVYFMLPNHYKELYSERSKCM